MSDTRTELFAGHTPGPWTLETVKTSIGSCHKIGPFPGNRVRPENHACVYADGEHWLTERLTHAGKELLANARLIEAAPLLLAERDALAAENARLREALHAFMAIDPTFGSETDELLASLAERGSHEAAMLARVVIKARAALGETP